MKNNYNEDSIQELRYPDNIRMRPTMYIGNVGIEGNNHLAKEVIDNSVDEALNGYGNHIMVEINNDEGYCKVSDKGRGIPPKAIEKAFTILHSSGKFNKDDYQTSGGLNGVGTTAVNALSNSFKVLVRRDGKLYSQSFKKGIKQNEVKVVKKGLNEKETGTTIIFYPDEEIMETTKFDCELLKNELEMKSYINKGVKFSFKEIFDSKESKFTYYHPTGINEYIKDLGKDKLLFNPVSFESTINTKRKNKDIKVVIDVAFSYTKDENENIRSFCNSLYTSSGGEHVKGLKTGLTSFIKKYINDNKLLSKKDENLEISGDNIRAGIIAIVSIKHPDPLYDSQTKDKLNNTEVSGAVNTALNDFLTEWSELNPKIMKIICNKAILLAKAAEAAKKAKENITKKGEGLFSATADITKFSNCLSRDPSEKELFIVEGRSANGTAKRCRDKQIQALYAMRGKPLNANNESVNKIMANKEYSDLTYIITGSNNNLDDNFNVSQLKFNKIILLADADIDGLHIRGLLTSFFFKHMKELVTEGHLYIAQPPLYSIKEKGKVRYFLDQNEYDEYIYEKLKSDYTFKRNNRSLDILNMISKLEKYNLYLNQLQSISEIDKDLIDVVTRFYNNESTQPKNIFKYIKGIGEFINKKENNDITIEGSYNYNFISTSLKKIISTIKENIKYLTDNKLDILTVTVVDNNTKEESPLTIAKFNEILNKVTPSSRSRMKGLGEMDADELWETTMNPGKRNLIKVEVSDLEEADNIMEALMNSNHADKRKTFILKHQEEYEEI